MIDLSPNEETNLLRALAVTILDLEAIHRELPDPWRRQLLVLVRDEVVHITTQSTEFQKGIHRIPVVAKDQLDVYGVFLSLIHEFEIFHSKNLSQETIQHYLPRETPLGMMYRNILKYLCAPCSLETRILLITESPNHRAIALANTLYNSLKDNSRSCHRKSY